MTRYRAASVDARCFTPVNLQTLAVEITVEHAAAQRAETAWRQHAIAAGERLIDAKRRRNKHGGWLPWLAENVASLNARTAQRYVGHREACGRSPARYLEQFVDKLIAEHSNWSD